MLISWIIFYLFIFIAATFDFNQFTFLISNLAYFIDFPSLIIIVVPTIFFAVGSYSWDVYTKTWSVTFGSVEEYDNSELKEIQDCVILKGNMALIMGILGTILGGIILLQNLSDISETEVGPASAVMSITLFYGLMFKALNMATACRIAKKLKD